MMKYVQATLVVLLIALVIAAGTGELDNRVAGSTAQPATVVCGGC
jgi:hypothetical protein